MVLMLFLAIISLLRLTTALTPDLFLHGVQLRLRYDGTDWLSPGGTLDTQDTIGTPELSGTGLSCDLRYLLFFIDLDAVIPGTATSTVVLHWYQPDLILDCTNKSHPNRLKPDENHSSSFAAAHIPPQPPPCSHHRYAYLLFQQSKSYRFPECFAHIPPKTLDARAGFDLREFMSAADLGSPVAINYFFARNNATGGHLPSPEPSPTTTSFHFVTCTPMAKLRSCS